MSSYYTHLIKNKQPLEPFILEVDTTLGDGLNQMRMPIQGTNMEIDWGDGTTETRTETSVSLVTHSYASAGIYDITITNLEYVNFNNTGDKSKPTELKSWGGSEWNDLKQVFSGCNNIDLFDTPIPEWLNVTSLFATWFNCTSLTTTPNVNNLVNVTSLRETWRGCTSLTTTSDVNNLINVTSLYATWSGCSSLTTAPTVSALVNVTSLFATWYNCLSLTELPLIGFHIENVTDARFMATFVTATNYDAILVDFEARLESLYPSGVGYPNSGLNIDFGNSTYTIGSTAETARTNLINTFGWNISDGG